MNSLRSCDGFSLSLLLTMTESFDFHITAFLKDEIKWYCIHFNVEACGRVYKSKEAKELKTQNEWKLMNHLLLHFCTRFMWFSQHKKVFISLQFWVRKNAFYDRGFGKSMTAYWLCIINSFKVFRRVIHRRVLTRRKFTEPIKRVSF